MTAPTPDPWLVLDQAKEHLEIPAAVDKFDVELTEFMRRAEGAMVSRVGHVALRAEPVIEYRLGGGSSVRVNTLPIGLVTEISIGGSVIAPALFDEGGFGWYFEDDVDEKVGIIRHTTRFPSGRVKITYQPGHDEIPEDLVLASLELLRHLWETQRGTIATRPGLRGEQLDPNDTQAPRAPRGFTYPKRVMELIEPYLLIAVA